MHDCDRESSKTKIPKKSRKKLTGGTDGTELLSLLNLSGESPLDSAVFTPNPHSVCQLYSILTVSSIGFWHCSCKRPVTTDKNCDSIA